MSVPSTLLPCRAVSARPARRMAPKPDDVGAPNAPESRRPGAAGPRLSRRPVGRRSGVDPPFARSEWSDSGWCLVGTRARSYRVGGPKDAARSWAWMRLYSGRMQQGLAYRGSTPRRARQKSVKVARKMGYKGHDMRPFIVQSSQGNFPKSTPSKRGMTQPLTHSHVLEPRKTTHNDFLKPNKDPPQYFKKGDSFQ